MKLSERRKEALIKLEQQLKSGMKPNKKGVTKERKANPQIPLTEKDKKRIEKEIVNLKNKNHV